VQHVNWLVSSNLSQATTIKRDYLLADQRSSTIGTLFSNNFEDTIDDTGSRLKLWKSFFADEMMPSPEADAYKKYAGSLSETLPDLTEDEVDRAIRKVRRK